jgi:hypothetical protein
MRLKNLLAALSVVALASTGMGYITTAQAEGDHASGGGHASGSGGKGGSSHSSTESGHKDGGSGGGGSKSLEGKVFHSGGATDEHGSGKGKGKGPKYKGGKSGESSPDEGHSHDK